ncbi:argininosuccinate lyase [uncultured Bacteroides sp.]|uniref:argininosuccinate lyase n=1 Tax=uncultured Bacteroides sp. TaxID=162156 RepID=UPI0025843ECF|nr:argininosuccinate lyase [uncultured Bacteroides sp.]
MAQKLWEKNVQVNAEIDRFTVGRDREMDMYLAKYDVLGSMAHITMLESIGLLTADELKILLEELKKIYASVECGEFVIEDGVEDVHSQVELMLTRRLGDVGKKIHSGRSRNDQVLVDLKLFIRAQLKSVAEAVERLFHVLISQSNRYKNVLMPGYTHLQIAMPSSFGLWFGAYAESLVDDMVFLQAAYKVCNRNPLGSAAGYGSSFPLDREMTTRLLGFDSMNYNVVYAQMGRGKVERNVSFALASIAGTLSKMAFDACMFSCQNFGFVKLPDECTTGSSIMPHKKNPDVFELTRAKCNKIQALPQQIMMIMNNLPSGYFRDLQIIKEVFLPAFEELEDCLQMATYIMDKIKINEHILDDDKYLYMFSVEEVNRLAAEGMPFRDAYKKVGLDIEAGKFTHEKTVHHTHAGSIGNLCNDKIEELMQQAVSGFNFEKVEEAEKALLGR